MTATDWSQRSLSRSYVSVRDDGGCDTVVDGVVVYRSPANPDLTQLLVDIEKQRRAERQASRKAGG